MNRTLLSLGLLSLAVAAQAGPFDGPSPHHQLYLDVYNVTDFFDAETGGDVGFADHTQLADTIRPTATVLWDDRFRIELGVIAEKAYGSSPDVDSVHPWIQLLWQPVKPVRVLLGDLDIPHYYLPALFYPNNYFEQNVDPVNLPRISQLKTIPSNYFTQSTTETGAQVLYQKPNEHDDLFFNYEQQDVAAHNEKFALGFVHRNTWWDLLSLDYQAHWLHYGGEFNPHPIETRNDVAQAAGLEVAGHPWAERPMILGVSYSFLYSHLRQEAIDPAQSIASVNGHGHLIQAFMTWKRLKVIYGLWRGNGYYHEGGDPMFVLPLMNMATVRVDILRSQDFNLLLESTNYFIQQNNLGYRHDVKTAIHLQASWEFSIPLLEWNGPTPSPEGAPVPTRWDYGL